MMFETTRSDFASPFRSPIATEPLAPSVSDPKNGVLESGPAAKAEPAASRTCTNAIVTAWSAVRGVAQQGGIRAIAFSLRFRLELVS